MRVSGASIVKLQITQGTYSTEAGGRARRTERKEALDQGTTGCLVGSNPF